MKRSCTCAWSRAAWAVLFAAGLWLAAVGPAGTALGATSGASYYNQAQTAAKRGDYRNAVPEYEQAILHGHNDPGTYYQLGLAFRQTHQLNYAAWAIATALSDPVFSATNAAAGNMLAAVQNAGGADSGPPSILQAATVATLPLTPALRASQESASAFSALQDPTQAYFSSPEFAADMSLDAMGTLSQAAKDAADN